MPVRDDELGGGRGRRGAHVRGEVGQRDIRFVPDAGDHREPVRHDRANDPLVVECPQVLEGATAPREDRHCRSLLGMAGRLEAVDPALDPAQRPSDALRGSIALDQAR